MKTTIITISSIVILGIVFAIWGISVSNSEIKIRNRGLAQIDSREAYYDKMWKIINQDAQVADQYKEAFKEIYPKLIEGRYSQGDGSFMKWIQEHNPEFNTNLYEKLMVAIEAERNGFFLEQQKLIDIDRQHKTMRQTFPNKMIIGKRLDLQFEIISSTIAKQVSATGIDDDVDLFKK